MKINKTLRSSLPLAIMPLGYVFWSLYIYYIKGPSWMMIPQDLGYTYLINALNILYSEPLGVLIHPAITVVGFMAFYIKIAHLFFGQNDLITDVFKYAEFYFELAVFLVIFITGLASFLMGLFVNKSLKDYRYSIILQSFFILPQPYIFILQSFLSPESFVTILFMLQVGLLFILAKSYDYVETGRLKIIFLGALVAVLALATKFTAAPILILFSFVIRGIKEQAYYCFFVVLCLLVIFGPVLSNFENVELLIINILGLINSLNTEALARGQPGLFNVGDNFIVMFNSSKHYVIISSLVFISTILLRAYEPVRKFSKDLNLNLYRANLAFSIVAFLGFIILGLRPQNTAKYAFSYLPLLLASLGIFVFYLNKYVERTCVSKWHNSVINCGFIFTLIIFSFKLYNHQTDDTRIKKIVKQKNDAIQMDKLTYGNRKDNTAIITGISASNKATAFFHSYVTSRLRHAKFYREVIDNRHFDYGLDGENVYYYGADGVSLSELQEIYDKLLFWSSKSNFKGHEWRKPPDAIWKSIYSADMELLKEIVALSFSGIYDTSKKENSKLWSTIDCELNEICFVFENTSSFQNKPLSHIKLIRNQYDSRLKEVSFVVEGSTNNSDWVFIEELAKEKKWDGQALQNLKPGDALTYELQAIKYYKYYKLRFKDFSKGENIFPFNLNLFSRGGCSQYARILEKDKHFIKKLSSGSETEVTSLKGKIGSDFYENVGLPVIFETKLSDKELVSSYSLSVAKGGWKENIVRMPSDWRLLGMIDGNWMVLDEKSSINWIHGEEKLFNIQPVETRRLRLEIYDTVNKGSDKRRRLIISLLKGLEMEIYDKQPGNGAPVRFGSVKFYSQNENIKTQTCSS